VDTWISAALLDLDFEPRKEKLEKSWSQYESCGREALRKKKNQDEVIGKIDKRATNKELFKKRVMKNRQKIKKTRFMRKP
jgi:hypothetical protein